MGNTDKPEVKVDEVVILSKFDGDSTDSKDEIERVTVENGLVVSHDKIKDGEVVGPVEDGNLTGNELGRLVSDEKSKEVE